MFLKELTTHHLVEILDTEQLYDPFATRVKGRYNFGEELPDPEMFNKSDLVFCSDEKLPRCWLDPHYRQHDQSHVA
jgi:hypothetical protein